MTRAEILADTVARLEAERYAPPVRPPEQVDLPPVTPAQAKKHLADLKAALRRTKGVA